MATEPPPAAPSTDRGEPSSPAAGFGGPYDPKRDPTVVLLAVITVAAAVALVAGIAPSGTFGPGGGPVFPILGGDGGPTEVHLQVQPNQSQVQVGDAVAVTVLDGEGRPVEDATVRVDGERRKTGPDGRIGFTFESPGEHQLTATRADTEEKRYHSGTATVSVVRERVALSLTTNASTITAGRSVGVRVTRPNGSPVAATVSAGEQTVETRPDGRATLTFDTAGRRTLTAERSATRTERFEAASADLTVRRRQVELTVERNTTDAVVGRPLTVTVTRSDTGEAVDATLTAGGHAYQTGPDGRVRLSFPEAGAFEVRVTASQTPAERYVPATVTVDVRRERVPLELRIADDPDVGEAVTATLVRADTGAPVAGTIQSQGVEQTVGPDGTSQFVFQSPGEYVLVGQKAQTATERFVAAETTVRAVGPQFAARLGAPDRVAPGEEFDVLVRVENTGNRAGTTTVTYSLAGSVAAKRQVALAPGETRRLRLSVTAPAAAGEHVQWVRTTGAVDLVLRRSITVATNATGVGSGSAAVPGD